MAASFSRFKSDGDKRVHTAITGTLPKHFILNLRIIIHGIRVDSGSISKDIERKRYATARNALVCESGVSES